MECFHHIPQVPESAKLSKASITTTITISGIKAVDFGEYRLMVQPQVNGVIENVTKVIMVEERRDDIYRNVTTITLICIGVIIFLLFVAVVLWNYRQRLQVLHRRNFGAFDIGFRIHGREQDEVGLYPYARCNGASQSSLDK